MEIQGQIIAVMERRTGQTDRGTWTAQDYVVETHAQYPTRMMFTVFGTERLQRFALTQGAEVRVFFDIDAHERNGRWYNTITAYDVRPATAAPQQSAPQSSPQSSPQSAPQSTPQGTGTYYAKDVSSPEQLPF